MPANTLYLFLRPHCSSTPQVLMAGLGLMEGVSMTEGPHPSVRVGESGRHVELGEWLLPQERLLLCRQLTGAAS
jgi:hypothetical protein